jgi:hypothetical protein
LVAAAVVEVLVPLEVMRALVSVWLDLAAMVCHLASQTQRVLLREQAAAVEVPLVTQQEPAAQAAAAMEPTTQLPAAQEEQTRAAVEGEAVAFPRQLLGQVEQVAPAL